MNAVERLLSVAETHAARTFLVEARTGSELTFGELHDSAHAVASELRRRGLRKGDRLAVVAHNSAALVRLYFGALYAGVVVVPVNPALVRAELQWIVEHSGARLLVATSETHQLAVDCPPPALGLVVLADGRAAAAAPADVPVLDLDALPAGEGLPLEGVDPRDTLVVTYTSGTTGRPKGVVHRIADLVDNAAVFTDVVGVRPEHRFYGVLAMTYLGGYYNLLLLPYVAGASVALVDAFDARAAVDFWSAAREHGVTALWPVPTIMSIVLDMDRGTNGETFCREHVTLTLTGTAPLPMPLRRAFEERYGVTVLENYALSETLFLTTNRPGEPTPERSVGRPIPGIDVRIADDGEVQVRTPYLMEGYFGGEQLEPGTWFATGDVGELDPEAGLTITGRKKDVIIRGGVNVSPAMAEEVLLEHPAVLEVAVVGVPHAHYGEDSAAVLRLADGIELQDIRSELVAACRERLGATSRPGRYVALDALPHSTSGKVQKVRLREMLTQDGLR